MFKKLAISLALVAALAAPIITHAALRDDVLAQLQRLLDLVASLQQQLAALEEGASPVEVNTSPTPTGEACPNLTRGLGPGAKGGDVGALQRFLRNIGDFTYAEITNYYGSLTTDAVRVFQCREMGVCFGTPDTTGYGVVGPKTRAAIARVCGAVSSEPVACTSEYAPVCGQLPSVCPDTSGVSCPQVMPTPKTYPNTCAMKKDGAMPLYRGVCRDTPGTSTTPNDCRVWYDGCNTCTRTTPGGEFACTLRYCVRADTPRCEAYFEKAPPLTRDPVIHAFAGPTTLGVNERGVWRVTASDPQNGTLRYRIDWGEKRYGSAFDVIKALADTGFEQRTTFSHTYTLAGTYTVTITVRDDEGRTARSSMTVVVGDGEAEEGFSVAPSSGTAPLTVTATITLPPRPSFDLVEVCGPIGVGAIAWGDGALSSPTRLGCSSQRVVTATHTYQSSGTYHVVFTRTDNTRYTETVTINDRATSTFPGNGTMCFSGGYSYSEGYETTCIDPDNDGTVTCSPNGRFVCRSGSWEALSGPYGPTCQGGSTYGGGYYEQCDSAQNTLSIFEPSGGSYQVGDDIRVSWSATIQRADVGMYLVLEDEIGGRQFKSMKVTRGIGQAILNTGSSCNGFFSDGIEADCASLKENIANGNVRYRIRAVIYTPASACFGFCPSGNTTLHATVIEASSAPFTLGS